MSARPRTAGTARTRRSSVRIAVPIMIGAAAMIMVAGCSSGNDQSGSAQAAPQGGSSSAAGRTGSAGQGNGRPGVSGMIAEIDGKTVQVQSDSSQTTVTYNGKTKISKIDSGSAADLATGLCAMVRSDGASTSQSLPSSLTASSVTLTAADGGQCSAGFGTGGGGRPDGTPSGAPSDATGQGFPGQGGPGGGSGQGDLPTARPSGAPSGAAGRAGTMANGKITKVDGSTFVIKAQQRGSSSTSAVTVTVGKDTELTFTKTAKPSAIKKNQCVSAFGASDDTGALTAASMTLSASKDGQCTTGFGQFGRPSGQRTNG